MPTVHSLMLAFTKLVLAAGIGAQIDHMASALGVAIEEGRVLLLDFGDVWATGHFCGQHMTVDTCYFKPISSCSLVDVYGEKFVQQSQAAIRDQLPATRQLVHSERIIFSGLSTKEHAWWKVPSQFNTLLAAPLQNNSVRIGGVPAHTYWWKSQAVAYIAQLNDKMSEKLLYLRHLMYPEFTVPPGTVSVHVRHGDKGSEMRLLPDDVYQDKVQELMAMFPNQFPGKVFLSTEDPQTVEHFSSSSLNVSHVFMKRSNHQHSSPWSVPDLSEEMLYSLLNLQLALMCDAWVCTLASMWCTLIDRLRATLECKAGGVYIDGHGHTQGLGYAM